MYKEYNKAWDELLKPDSMFATEEIMVRGNKIKAFVHSPKGGLRDIWLLSAAHASRDYLVYRDEQLTYEQCHAQVASIANWLQETGINPGDRIAIAMRNYPEWLLSYWSIVSMGATVVGMNAWWTGPEMIYALKDSAPKVIICDQERLDVFASIRDQVPTMKVVTVRADSGSQLVETSPWSDLLTIDKPLPDANIDPDDDACIFYTSGTTGKPKGAQLTHRGCVANIMNLGFASTVHMEATKLLGKKVPEPDSIIPVALITTPLFHVTANNCAAHMVTVAGGKLVLMYKWDPAEAIQLISKEKLTSLGGVPIMAREVINHSDFAKADTSTLMTIGGGGAQLQPDLVAKIDSASATASPNTGYGMTEVCGIISAVQGDYFLGKPDSCGRILPGLEGKCFDNNGNEVSQGEIGELWVRGAPVVKGYLNSPKATAKDITDGWLHTGDMAKIDEHGFLYIVDRKKDMILRGGENVYCAEVESAVFDYPAGVAECVAFSVPDERLGEEVGVALIMKKGATATATDIKEHCRKLIANYKVPRYIWFLENQVPRNANGKFMKSALIKQLELKDSE